MAEKKEVQGSCETCEFYVYDDEMDMYVCDINLDEDEMCNYLTSGSKRCAYYRFYDEYKTVQKQN